MGTDWLAHDKLGTFRRDDGRPSVAEIWAKEQAERDALEARMLADAQADATAVWSLAEHYLPADLKEWGERNGIPEFAQYAWKSAFVAGWRAAHRKLPADQ